MVQFIVSGRDKLGQRIVLWRRGEYQYEIETTAKDGRTLSMRFGKEYYDALDMFEKMAVTVN